MKKFFDYWFWGMLIAGVASLAFFSSYYGCPPKQVPLCNGQCDTCPSGSCEVKSEIEPEVDLPFLLPQIETPIPPPPSEWSAVDPHKIECGDYLRATCRLRGSGSGGSGTCYKIDDKYVYVLTCRHVVGKTKNFVAEFWIDGKITGKYNGKVSVIFDVDAAVILFPVDSFKEGELPVAIPVSASGPDKDKPIISVGCPGLSWQSLFEGHITKMNKESKQSFEFIPPPKGGRSGSAILQDGKIVGVLWGATKERGYAVNSKDLGALVKPSNLMFSADWCQYCRQMKPVVESLKESGLDVLVVDYDLNTALAELYGIDSLPAYVNTEGDTISGIKSSEELREFYRKPE